MSIHQHDIIYFLITDRFFGLPNPNVDPPEPENPKGYHGGNIQGVIEKIPYLKQLGITALWITPVYLQIPPLKGPQDLCFSTGYHGYWPLDFNTVDPHFCIFNGRYENGSKRYIRDLADALHKEGIKLILDMVVNHTGYMHPGTSNAPDNPTPIRPNWYNRSGISAAENVIEGELAALPDMDLDNPDVADYHIQTILSWIRESGIDAIRMDTVKHVERAFWNYFKTQIKGRYPEITLVGEVLEFDVDAISQYQQHWAFDSLFDFPLQQAITDVFVYDQPMKRFVSPFNSGSGILERDSFYTNHNKLVTLLDNHDLSSRFMSLATERTSDDPTKKAAARLMKLALSFLFTIRGIPQIYYGTEIGMEGRYEPENRGDFEWEKIGPDQQVLAEFETSHQIHEHTKKLIAMRKRNEALCSGNMISLYVDDFIFAFLRYFDHNIVIAIFNNGRMDMPYPMDIHIHEGMGIPHRILEILEKRKMKCTLSGKECTLEDGRIQVQLEAKSAQIFIS